MREIPAELLSGPFTVAAAERLGISEKVLRGSRFRAPFPGVRVSAALPDGLELRCAAAVLALPASAVLSHQTAALLHRLPLPFGPEPDVVHASVPAKAPPVRVAGIRAHRAHRDAADVVRLGGLPVTTMDRTWCDLAAVGWTRTDLVVLADAVLRRRGPRGRQSLAAAVDAWTRRRGAAVLREALRCCEFRVDSPMETRLRLLLLDAGLPPPVVNVAVLDGYGEVIHTPDLSWPHWRVAVDYDGVHHLRHDHDRDVAAQRQENWRRRHDISRQEELQAAGWVLRVATAYDVLHAPAQLVDRVRAALRSAGGPG